MENRSYYYLIAGLPDLVLDQRKLPFPVAAFCDELKTHLHPEDYALSDYLLRAADNENLLNFLMKTDKPRNELGRIPEDTLQEALRDPSVLPGYMQPLVRAFEAKEPLWPGMSWENQLAWLYYDHAIEAPNEFLRQWFAYDRDLRNILAAISARRNQLSMEGQLIGEYHLTTALRNSHARDFGLGPAYAYVERLIQWENNNWLERELAIDAMRWNFIEELNAFHYFDIEVVLGYLIKLMLLERWVHLDQSDGHETFQRLLQQLIHSEQLSNALT